MNFKFTESLTSLDSLYNFSKSEFKYSWSKELIQDYLDKESSIYVFAYLEGTISGYCFCDYNEYSNQLHLYQICVDSRFRGKGIGQKLMKETLKLTSLDIDSIFLEVETSNKAALCFYKSLGFETLNKIPSFYSDGSDACAMHCRDSKLAKLLNN